MYNIYCNSSVEGSLQIKVRAVNAFSALDADVDLDKILLACQNYSAQNKDLVCSLDD